MVESYCLKKRRVRSEYIVAVADSREDLKLRWDSCSNVENLLQSINILLLINLHKKSTRTLHATNSSDDSHRCGCLTS